MTVNEIAAATGIHADRVRVALRALLADGQWLCVKVYRTAINGEPRHCPAYRPK